VGQHSGSQCQSSAKLTKNMTETVHIVDDNADVRDSLCSLLEIKGYSVFGHASAEEFLNRFSADEALCIIVDLRMPGMSGLELQACLAKQSIDVPFIMITGYGDVPTAVKALKSGATDFIEKPIDTAVLLAAVQKAAETRRLSKQEQESASLANVKLAALTPREKDVLHHIVQGSQNKIIAHELGISARTVENHRARLMDKLQASSLAELVKLALAGNLDSTYRIRPQEESD
jgi:two-component system, LuxR family, response regulator FixJ